MALRSMDVDRLVRNRAWCERFYERDVMDGDGIVAFFFVIWLLFAIGIGAAAISRGRSGFLFGLLSFIMSPVVALILLALMPDLARQEKEESQRREDAQRDHQRELEAIKAVAKPTGPASLADELEKLSSLKDRGLLTQREFDEQKLRLLRIA